MSVLNDSLSDALTTSESLTMTVTGYVPLYGTVEGADRYFSERLDSQLWEIATAVDKRKALITATRAIDTLRFSGSKTSETQPLEWPRNSEETIPDVVQRAAYEEAFALLKGIDPETEAGNLNVTSRVFGKVSTDYDYSHAPEHIVAGIASFKAWQLLKPVLDPARGVRLRRGS